MQDLQHLLQPIKIRSTELSNRIVMPPMGTNLANPDGTVSEANLAYMKRRAQSGAGLYITEVVGVHPRGRVTPAALQVYEDTAIPGLKKLADVVHSEGAKIALQLHHAGRESMYQLKQGTALAPSAIPSVVFGGKPNEMTLDDIHEAIAAFGSGAVRAREAGFDMVELHGAHGYLLCQFLSEQSNQRQDEYGGSLHNRARFIVECLQEVRKQVGNDFPVCIRISADELRQNGFTVEDMQQIVPEFVKAGADILHCSFGTHGSRPAGIIQAPIEYEQGFNVGLARKIKEAVDVPVIGVGRFTDPSVADDAIARGDADMIAVGRQHLADPDFIKNARAGRSEDTFECLACNQGCIEHLIFEGGKISCAINPETGHELVYPRQAARDKKKVWVIGGGPAGLTAASEAARLGHQVTLFEKGSQTGGQVLLAARAPHKEPYAVWVKRLAKRAEKNGATLKTGVEVTAKTFEQDKPDAVILASGGENICPNIPGVDLPHVSSAWDVINDNAPRGEHVLIIGAALVGVETADYLADKGCRDITLVEQLPKSPINPMTVHGFQLLKRMQEANAKMHFNTRVEKIENEFVVVNTDGKEERLGPFDQVILAAGTRPCQDLKELIEQKGVPCVVVGDASKAGRILEATSSGAHAAWNL